jgi:AP-1 complex subunit mu
VTHQCAREPVSGYVTVGHRRPFPKTIMPVTAVLILDSRGRLLIARDFRGEVDLQEAAEAFRLGLERNAWTNGSGDAAGTPPLVPVKNGAYYFATVKHNDLYFIAVDVSPYSFSGTLVAFLTSMIRVFGEYFGKVVEESIRDNFVIVYELLDEMADFGYPQTTEPKILQEYVVQDYHVMEQPKPPMALTNAVSWRSEGIHHNRNEVFLDVIETVNMVIGPQGNVLRAGIHGSIVVKCFLSGMPELNLGLNESIQIEQRGSGASGSAGTTPPNTGAIELEDVKFHQCVKLPRFETERVISFIPPDGEFELMSYRVANPTLRPLFSADAAMDMASHRIDYLVRARSLFKAGLTANDVSIWVPVPEDADSPKFQVSSGRVKYAPEKDALHWRMKQFPGQRENSLQGYFRLPSVANAASRNSVVRRPIQIQFEIPYFTISGMQVRYLKVWSREGYTSYPWVRYITRASDYEIRLS